MATVGNETDSRGGGRNRNRPQPVGYGYQMAERLSRARSLLQLAHLRGAEPKSIVLDALKELKKPV